MNTEKLIQENKDLKKLNKLYRSMLLKVERYGLNLTPEENKINLLLIRKVKKKKSKKN